MKTCSVRSKRRDQYQSDNRETNDNLEEATIFPVLVHRTEVVRGAGLGSRGASCKRHEMSSIKNVWGGVG